MALHSQAINIQAPLRGQTGSHSVAIPKGSNCIVLASTGGEFRVVLSTSNDETRGSGRHCVTIALGQRGNSVSTMGFGNPFHTSLIYSTSHAKALVTNDIKRPEKTWWLGFDKNTGWVFFGAGAEPGQFLLLSAALQGEQKTSCTAWTHVGFSNWKRPAQIRVCAMTKLPRMHTTPKFDKFGNLARFEGLTVVSHHGSAHSPLHEAMRCLQVLLRNHPRLKRHFALLPTSSFHVTTMDLLSCKSNQYDADQKGWDERYSAVSQCFQELKCMLPATLRFIPQAVDDLCKTVQLKPDKATAAALKRWRTAMAAKTQKFGVRLNPRYKYHSTFAYVLYKIKAKETREALASVVAVANHIVRAVGPITIPTSCSDLCRFHDMGSFKPLL